MPYLAVMSFRPGLAAVVALMLPGCATPEATSETSQQRAERERLKGHVTETMGRL